MILGRVVGTIVSTVKHAKLEGRKLLAVQPLDAALKPAGRCIIAIDSVQAGPGEIVLVCDEGNSARLILGDSLAPIRAMIIAIVDTIERYQKE